MNKFYFCGKYGVSVVNLILKILREFDRLVVCISVEEAYYDEYVGDVKDKTYKYRLIIPLEKEYRIKNYKKDRIHY